MHSAPAMVMIGGEPSTRHSGPASNCRPMQLARLSPDRPYSSTISYIMKISEITPLRIEQM